MKFNTYIRFLSLLVLLSPAAAAAGKITGEQIINRVYNRPTAKDQSTLMTMTLTNKSGSTRVRSIKQFSKDFGNSQKSILFFVSPADVRNTSFMNWSYDEPGKSDDQWIYLPALKKIKRVSSDSKGDYFMGSDFTYDDLGDRHPSADTHKLLKTLKSKSGKIIYVVESKPKDEDYMYSRTETWIYKDQWIGKKKKFYDEDGDLLKILEVKEVKKIKGYDVVTRSKMKNVQNGHSTEIALEDVVLESGIPNSKFTERMMKRGIR